MNAGTKLAAYGLALLAVAGIGAAVGSAAGPFDIGDDGAEHDDAGHGGDERSAEPAAHEGDEHGAEAGELPAGGLAVAQDGYRFEPVDRTLAPGAPQPFAFRIMGPEGTAVTEYDVAHDKELHLVVVSRDLSQYAHVHPDRAADGTWSVVLPALAPGSYRAFADFTPTGHSALTLGVDVTVTGPATPTVVVDRAEAEVAGYTVTLDGDLAASSEVTVTVRRDGEVVTTEPYLGAAGHLVAIRDGDLAYLHVHPLDETPAGPVRFAVEVPSEGRYALFFDFAHEGVVHTAPFVVTVGEPAPSDDGHGHAPGEEH